MARKLIAWIAASAALLPLAVRAQEAAEPDLPAATKTRAEVRAGLDEARRTGGMKVFSAGYIESAPSLRSRAEVVAELRRARASGEWSALNAEAVDFREQREAAAARRLAQRGDPR